VPCIILFMMCLFGCSKKSVLEGKIVDGKGRPMAGVKMVAKQAQPTNGYELFELTTGTDGGFKFSNLFPNSVYELIAYPDGMIGNSVFKTNSAPEGQTKKLPEPITIHFLFSTDDTTVFDTKTDLMWAKNANIAEKGMNWNEAVEWVKGLDIRGHRDWRLPKKAELEQIVKYAGKEKPSEFFKAIGFSNVQSDYYWSSDEGFSDGYGWSWSVHMNGYFVDRINKVSNMYAWPVRSGQ